METETGFPASPPHAQQRFELLQERLVPLWHSIEAMNQDPQIVPIDSEVAADIILIALFQEDLSQDTAVAFGHLVEDFPDLLLHLPGRDRAENVDGGIG